MSSAEAAKSGYEALSISATRPEAEAFAEKPVRSADVQVPLRQLDLYLPTKPLFINGAAYEVGVNEDLLASAINVVAEENYGRRYLYPRQIVVHTIPGETVVGMNNQLKTSIIKPQNAKIPPILQALREEHGTSLTISLPSATTSTLFNEEGLVGVLESQANRDLLVGLGQNLKAKRKNSAALRVSGIIVGAAAGEGAGIAISETGYQMLGRGTFGAFLGGMAVMSAAVAADKIRMRGGSIENMSPWIVSQSRDFQEIHHRLEEVAKQGQIISLSKRGEPA